MKSVSAVRSGRYAVSRLGIDRPNKILCLQGEFMNALLAGDRDSRARISDYLNDIALDPRKAAAHRRDPDAAMAASPLTPDDKAVIESADQDRVYRALSGGGPMAPAAIVAVVVIVNNAYDCKSL